MSIKRTASDREVMEQSAPARGRKRFFYDIQKAASSAEQGVEVKGLRLLTVARGEEDGSFDCTIVQTDGELLVCLTFLVSDASEYPSDHTFFCSSQDTLPTAVSSVTESVHEDGAVAIHDLLLKLLERIAKRLGSTGTGQGTGAASDDEDDDEDDLDIEYDMDDDLMALGNDRTHKLQRAVLQREFNQIVGFGYNPGFIPFGVDDFAISVSMPAKDLAGTIPVRALMAWDKRLLSRPQHLTLLVSGLRGVYPIVQPDATYNQTAYTYGAIPQFRVGLTNGYKPSSEDAAEMVRKFGLKEEYDEKPTEPEEEPEPVFDDDNDEEMDLEDDFLPPEDEPVEEPEVAFRPFSLSASLESLLNGHFMRILRFRIQYRLGWAGAETLLWTMENSQQSFEEIMRLREQEIRVADIADEELSKSYVLPEDPLATRVATEPVNIPLAAYSYLLRRITLCSRFCLVCHQQLQEDLDALKPYICGSELCTYQYYSLNRGPSLEYEICANPVTTDLLVSLAYIAAAEGTLDDPLPTRMGLRVDPTWSFLSSSNDSNALVDFDGLEKVQMRTVIAYLINRLPPIAEIKRHLEQPGKPGRAKPQLKDMDKNIPDAAWSVLRWIIGSCTAHLEELESEDELVKNIGSDWRQFRFSVGAPDAEARFRTAVEDAKARNENARSFPSLYAFHGSPANNWHSIIRHGLWFKHIANGRAYGNGVYFAKEGTVSLGNYSRGAHSCWRGSAVQVNSCVALAEIVNLPQEFVSQSPFFVVNRTDWIICRYLMIKSAKVLPAQPHLALPLGFATHRGGVPEPPEEEGSVPYVPLDPAHPLTLGAARIKIPDPAHALQRILDERRADNIAVEYDEHDRHVFEDVVEATQTTHSEPADEDEEMDKPADDWQHDRAWVEECIQHLIPPPIESSTSATSALQRELKMMLREQRAAKSLRELGWYMPEDLMGDNLYQWIVELHTFDKDIPVAKDMETQGVNSLVFEIRFPAAFPHAPPFFRILKPRFLPFSQGGGGHITLGGSMCMDLLTADGWLPSYSIAAILLQIKLAISNLEPKPARLARDWQNAYGMQEALDNYKRVAAVHGWKIPQGIDRLG